MKISIVIATFNAARHLAECLDSCIEQTWQDKEIIVIDGGSTDGTLEIIRQRQRHIVFWVSEPDKGIYDAWNKALKHVTGTWVLFRGADDVFWSPSVLEQAAACLTHAARNELVCYGTVVVTGADGCIRRIMGEPWPSAKQGFFQLMSIPHPGTFHHASLFRSFGSFDPSYRIAGDYDFLLRVLRHSEVEAKFLPRVIVTRMRDGGESGNHFFRSDLEAIAARRRNAIPGLPLGLYWRLCANAGYLLLRWALRVLLGSSQAAAFHGFRRRRASRALESQVKALSSAPFDPTAVMPENLAC